MWCPKILSNLGLMITEIQPDIYQVKIPLPGNPLKALNSYLIKEPRRSLIIDKGFRHEKCLSTMLGSLEKLNVNLDMTDFFITHLHVDHVGLVGNLDSKTSRVYMSRVEASIVNSIITEPEKYRHTVSEVLFSHGFPLDELRKAIQDHPGYRYIPRLR